MTKSPFFILFLFFCASSNAQKKLDIGIQLQSSVNIFNSEMDYDRSRFNFGKPITLGGGIVGLYSFDDKNAIALNLTYNNKSVKVRYKINETDLPYIGRDDFYQKYHAYGLLLKYRRSIYVKGLSFYTSIGGYLDFSKNYLRGMSIEDGFTEELDEELSYEQNYFTIENHKKVNYGLDVEVGKIFGTKGEFDISLFAQVPLTTFQDDITTIESYWHFKNKDYYHTMVYKGFMYHLGVRGTYYVFKK